LGTESDLAIFFSPTDSHLNFSEHVADAEIEAFFGSVASSLTFSGGLFESDRRQVICYCFLSALPVPFEKGHMC
jgi:hypothetical protein